ACPRGLRPRGWHQRAEALGQLPVGLRAEVLADHEHGADELVEVGAAPDLDAHPAMRSSGAYSSISRRSPPSSKRTVTTPSGSILVTIPEPSVWWRTASPVESSGTSARGANSRGGGRAPSPAHAAGASRSRSTPCSGSSSRKREGRFASLRPYRARRAAWVSVRRSFARVIPT